ncbi:MAG TPA: hypothetical protein VHY37_02970 [Tepidisphaeraceae bacterium]|nr:hypothetical protein [Tepidisphaeraceae bacterium]
MEEQSITVTCEYTGRELFEAARIMRGLRRKARFALLGWVFVILFGFALYWIIQSQPAASPAGPTAQPPQFNYFHDFVIPYVPWLFLGFFLVFLFLTSRRLRKGKVYVRAGIAGRPFTYMFRPEGVTVTSQYLREAATGGSYPHASLKISSTIDGKIALHVGKSRIDWVGRPSLTQGPRRESFDGSVGMNAHEAMGASSFQGLVDAWCQITQIRNARETWRQFEDGDRKPLQIMLETHLLIGGGQHLKMALRRRCDQRAVGQIAPAKFPGMRHIVAGEKLDGEHVNAVVQ